MRAMLAYRHRKVGDIGVMQDKGESTVSILTPLARIIVEESRDGTFDVLMQRGKNVNVVDNFDDEDDAIVFAEDMREQIMVSQAVFVQTAQLFA